MRSPATYDVTTYMRLDRDGTEVQVIIQGRYTEDVPGRYCGPPEDCYEGEPATADIIYVLDLHGQPVELREDEEKIAIECLLAVGAEIADQDDWEVEL